MATKLAIMLFVLLTVFTVSLTETIEISDVLGEEPKCSDGAENCGEASDEPKDLKPKSYGSKSGKVCGLQLC